MRENLSIVLVSKLNDWVYFLSPTSCEPASCKPHFPLFSSVANSAKSTQMIKREVLLLARDAWGECLGAVLRQLDIVLIKWTKTVVKCKGQGNKRRRNTKQCWKESGCISSPVFNICKFWETAKLSWQRYILRGVFGQLQLCNKPVLVLAFQYYKITVFSWFSVLLVV